ncbi:MAG: nucleoside triphosphate pyrophosphohydrolase [Maricaulaceae bacterium]
MTPPSRDPENRNEPGVNRLLALMARLRDPHTGCPWDVEQTFASIAPYTIEEAYEVADAIDRNALDELKSELGDLLLQVVFHAQMASEQGAFDFDAVAHAVTDKMIRRHPHVFGDVTAESPDGVVQTWEAIKAEERAEQGRAQSVLDDVPLALPALLRALKLQKRAARVGFDWPETTDVIDKLREEVVELSEALAARDDAHAFEEFGDLLFVIANLARKLRLDPEAALRAANAKFDRRFRHIEARLAETDRTPQDATLAEMEQYWVEAKYSERGD